MKTDLMPITFTRFMNSSFIVFEYHHEDNFYLCDTPIDGTLVFIPPRCGNSTFCEYFLTFIFSLVQTSNFNLLSSFSYHRESTPAHLLRLHLGWLHLSPQTLEFYQALLLFHNHRFLCSASLLLYIYLPMLLASSHIITISLHSITHHIALTISWAMLLCFCNLRQAPACIHL
jgi:hypothetical protein